MIDKTTDKILNKVPTYDQYSKNTKSAVSYIFMLFFLSYFVFVEFIKKDNCAERMNAISSVIEQKDIMIELLNARVTSLETALDTRNGAIKRIDTVVNNIGLIGGQK